MPDNWSEYRNKIIGFGEHSAKKSYYPALQEKLEQLEASQHTLATLINSINDGIVLHDKQGKIISLNKKAKKLFGIENVETAEYSFFDISAKRMHTEKLFAIWDEVLKGESRILEWTIVGIGRPEDEIDVQISLNRAKINNDYVIVGALRDFTERIQYERLLKRSEQKFRKLYERSNDALLIIARADFVVLDANRSAENLFSASEEQMRGTRLHELVNSTVEIIENLLKDESGNNVELEFINSSGIKKCILLSIRELDEDFAFVNAVDITERKLIEEKLAEQNVFLQKAAEKADELNRMKTNFLANMSHEIRTPLIGILGYSELMSTYENDEEVAKMSSIILKSGRRLLTTLNMILDLSRIEANRLESEESTFDAVPVIDEVVALFGESARRKNIELLKVFNASKIIVSTDERSVTQILNNLINNALKFTRQGSITIVLDAISGAEITHLMLKVIDTGIGISEKDQEVIWAEFRQASEGLGRSYEGTGLGLTITKKFVERLGGTITVSSAVGTGSEFIVLIPGVIEVQHG